MRRLELLRSRAFRLALLYAGLFGLSMSLLLAVITWAAGRYFESHVDEFVTSEVAMLQADYEVDGLKGLLGLLHERMSSDTGQRWTYLLVNEAGVKQLGNATEWPTAVPGPDGFLTLPARNEDEPSRVRARTVELPGAGRLLVGLDDYELFELREALARAMFLGLGLMLLLAMGGGVLVARASLAQIESINRVTQEINTGTLARRVPLDHSGDEFDRLGSHINAMLDRIQELLGAVRGVADNIAHDLRAPLSRHRQRLERARRELPAGEALAEFVERSIEEVDSVLGTFAALLRITQVESGALRQHFTPVDLAAIVRDAEQVYEPLAAARRQTLNVTAEALTVSGNRDLLFQSLANLLDNAIKYTPEGGLLELRLQREGAVAVLAVADNGPGIPVDQRDRVFQRLHRLDQSRGTPGEGLGLSLVRAVARLHGGSCDVEDNGPGARLMLRLPLTT